MADRFVYYLEQVFARGSFCLRKINTDPHTLAHVNVECQEDRKPKTKNFDLKTDFIQIRIHTGARGRAVG
jgi:hypothetical protein